MTIKLIAEVGSNWEGSLLIARQMITKARWSGADFVKFQMYNSFLYREHPLYQRLHNAMLDEEKVTKLKKYADKVGINFLCTPYYLGAVDILEKLKVSHYKIREKDADNRKLLEAVAATGKTTFVSVHDNFDLVYLNETFGDNLRLLFCIPFYPPKPHDMNLSRLCRSFMYDGLSDHYPQVISSLIGAVVLLSHGKKDIYIEKHLTLSHDFETIDREVSIDFKQLADLRHYLTLMEQMMD